MKAVIPALSNLNNNARLPNIDKAGRMYIVPVIGKELYEDLNNKYNSSPSTLNTQETILLKNIQLPLAAFALLDDISFIHTTITDNGIRTNQSANMAAAHRWEYKELENSLRKYAAHGMELLIEFLFENKGDYPLWTDNSIYKELSNLIIRSGSEFNKFYTVYEPHRTFWAIKPVMEMVQESYIEAQLGRSLLKWLMDKEELIITDGTQVDIKKLIKKSVAYLTIKHAGETLAVEFGPNGFTMPVSAGSESPEEGKAVAEKNLIKIKLDAANREGQNYLSRASALLKKIAAGEYGETLQSDINTVWENSPLKEEYEPRNYNNNKSFFVF